MLERNVGNIGENIAERFLAEKRYRIVGKNFRRKFGEIDIIVKATDGMLVFVEVKTLRNYGPEGLKPEDNLSSAKLKKFKRICEGYVVTHGENVREEKGWRMDLVCVEIPREEKLTYELKDCIIRHYENI